MDSNPNTIVQRVHKSKITVIIKTFMENFQTIVSLALKLHVYSFISETLNGKKHDEKKNTAPVSDIPSDQRTSARVAEKLVVDKLQYLTIRMWRYIDQDILLVEMRRRLQPLNGNPARRSPTMGQSKAFWSSRCIAFLETGKLRRQCRATADKTIAICFS